VLIGLAAVLSTPPCSEPVAWDPTGGTQPPNQAVFREPPESRRGWFDRSIEPSLTRPPKARREGEQPNRVRYLTTIRSG